MTLLLVFAIVIAVVALSVWAVRWIRSDGGPRPTPLPRHEDDWSSDLPSFPYSHRIRS